MNSINQLNYRYIENTGDNIATGKRAAEKEKFNERGSI